MHNVIWENCDKVVSIWAEIQTKHAKVQYCGNKMVEKALGVKLRGGVEDTRLEAKDTKKFRGQRQPFRGLTLSRPRTGMLEAKDTGAKVFQKKGLKNFFQPSSNL